MNMMKSMSYEDIIDDLKALAVTGRAMPKTIEANIRGTVVRIRYQKPFNTFCSYEQYSYHYPQFESSNLATVKRKVKEYYDTLNQERIHWAAVKEPTG